MTLPQSNKLTLLAAIALAFTLPFQTILADKTKAHPSTTAQVRLGSWWFARHAEKIAEIEEANDPKKDKKIELLMVGDSITNNFDKNGPGEAVWKKHFAPLNTLNLGFGGDRTNHVLWRLDHLPPLKTAPKAASLVIGTNNICWGSDKPKQAADGVQAITVKLRAMYPDMKILVLGVFPRRQNLDHPHRKQIIELNSFLPDLLKDIPNVTFLILSPHFKSVIGNVLEITGGKSRKPNLHDWVRLALASESNSSRLETSV